MFVLHGTNLAIHPKIDVYFVTGLLPRGEALQYPLPYGRVDLERFQACHFGGAPLTEGCISIASVTELVEKCALAAIV